jgi:hypothetical protein
MLAAGRSLRRGVPMAIEDGPLGERSNRMRANWTEEGWEGTSRRVAIRLRPAAVLLAVAWALVGSRAGADEPLRWKFKEGETLRFSIEQKMMMDTKGMGIERKSNRTHTLEFIWKVLSVGPGGEAEINHRTERIRMRAEEPPYMPFDFDSATSKEPPPGFEALARLLKAEVGAEFTFKIKPTGEIVDIKVPEETLKRLREAAPPGGPGAEISEKSLKETLLQASPPSFPEGPLEPGKSWTTKPARVPLPPFAMLTVDRTFTYQGPDPKSPNLLLVRIDSTAKIEPIEGSDVKAAIRKQEGKGSMSIDGQAGRVVSTRLGLKLDIAVTAGTGQVIEQSSETSSSMTLLP